MTALHVEQVSASYGRTTVLDALSLHVASGEVVAVLGASGSGKTTLLRVLVGFLRPAAGQVRFGDRVVASAGNWVPPESRRVGIVPQEGALFPHRDVAGNVGFGLPRRSGARIEEMLELVGLPGLGRRRPQELSGGQQQRVALARALAPEPEVLCLDEPFSALDAELRVRLRTEVREVLSATGTTTVLVTHDQEEAMSFADTVAVIRDGVVVQVGSPAQVYSEPVDLLTARFVGTAVELDTFEVRDGLARTALAVVEVPGALDGARGVVVLRPEQLRLSAATDAAPSNGTVASFRYHGHDSLVQVAVDGSGMVTVRAAGAASARPGDRVRVEVVGPGRLLDPAPAGGDSCVDDDSR